MKGGNLQCGRENQNDPVNRKSCGQQLQTNNLRCYRPHAWPKNTGYRTKERVDDEPGVVLAGEDPQEEGSYTGNERADSSDVHPS